jgi:hypothetical protein
LKNLVVAGIDSVWTDASRGVLGGRIVSGVYSRGMIKVRNSPSARSFFPVFLVDHLDLFRTGDNCQAISQLIEVTSAL